MKIFKVGNQIKENSAFEHHQPHFTSFCSNLNYLYMSIVKDIQSMFILYSTVTVQANNLSKFYGALRRFSRRYDQLSKGSNIGRLCRDR